MEEIAKTFGLCLLYMLPLFFLTVLIVAAIKDSGIMNDIIRILMNGLTGVAAFIG